MPLMPYAEAVNLLNSEFVRRPAGGGIVNFYGAEAASNYPHLHIQIDGTRITFMGVTYGPGGGAPVTIVHNGVMNAANLGAFQAALPGCNVPYATRQAANAIVTHVGAPVAPTVMTGGYDANFPPLG